MGTGKIIVCFLLCLLIWLIGLNWFIAQIPAQPVDDPRPADAIVVLTGGSGRLEYGLELLVQGKGRELFISGVSEGISAEQLLRGVPEPLRARLTPSDIKHITLGHKAENTIGNALETVRWLKKHNFGTIRLVTSNYHIPRSIEEFKETDPDIIIIPAPVFPNDFTLDHWWNDPESRFLMLSQYHKFLAAKLRHLIIPSPHGGEGADPAHVAGVAGGGISSHKSPSPALPPNGGGGRN